MIKDIVKDDFFLSIKSSEATQDDLYIVQDLKDTLYATNGGKGISAIQIGVPKQVCICSWGGDEIVMINPKITRERGQQDFVEGCLSVPGKYVKVPRAQKVWCEYTDENGNKKEIAEGGLCSRIIQHELEHMDGWCEVFSLVK
jgi:peptide deformylase